MAHELDNEDFHLLQLGALIQVAVSDYLRNRRHDKGSGNEVLPSKHSFDAQRTLLASSGALTGLVSSPANRLLEVSSQYFEARALHVVADQRVPDILARSPTGVDIASLASEVAIETHKLGRIMRCLCSIHIFTEVAPDSFANNRVSQELVGNEPLRAYILMFGLDIYSASDHLSRTLNDPIQGPSYKVDQTPWQHALSTQKSRWEWLEESIETKQVNNEQVGPNGSMTPYPGPFGQVLKASIDGNQSGKMARRPEHWIFGLAMLGGDRVFGEAHLHDFPWTSLGKATVVDVGGGVGGFCLQLSHMYPHLSFVVQDRAPVLEQAKSNVWPKENPNALAQGRISFVQHDFFQPQSMARTFLGSVTSCTIGPTSTASIFYPL